MHSSPPLAGVTSSGSRVSRSLLRRLGRTDVCHVSACVPDSRVLQSASSLAHLVSHELVWCLLSHSCLDPVAAPAYERSVACGSSGNCWTNRIFKAPLLRSFSFPRSKKKVLEPRVKEKPAYQQVHSEPPRTNSTTRHTQRDPSQYQDAKFDEQHQRSILGQSNCCFGCIHRATLAAAAINRLPANF